MKTGEQTDQGAGICVGRKFDSIEWKVIRITDDPIASIVDIEEIPTGEIGELIVRGPQVSPQYVTNTQANATSKIAQSQDSQSQETWHRIGDVGYLDTEGRFWYCGRKSHRVETGFATMFTIPVEAVFNAHPEIRRSALVGIGDPMDKTPVAIIELKEPTAEWEHIHAEVVKLASKHKHTSAIRLFLRHTNLPVDVRHNAKINREQLAEWAEVQLLSKP